MVSQTAKLSIVGVTFGLGLFVAVGGTVLGWFVIPNAVKSKITDEFQLKKGNDLFKQWSNVTVPIKLKFYVFNITNPDDLEKSTGEQIHLQEIGPYVYDEKRVKVNITIEGDRISYNEKITYFFNAKDSKGRETDIINTLNFPFISAGHAGYANGEPLAEMFVSMATMSDNPDGIVKRNVTVDEMLFKGWKLSEAYEMIPAEKLPSELVGLKFGYYRTRNDTPSKRFVIKSGANGDLEHIGHIVQYDQLTELPWWNITTPGGKLNPHNEQYCNRINGSDGTIFSPFVKKDTILRMFCPLACRSFSFVYDSDVNFRGIPAYKFKMYDGYLDNPEMNKEEACFCQRQSPKLAQHCPAGIHRVWPCTRGVPFVISQPHFYNGDDDLLWPVDMTPGVEELHKSFLIIEPTTGAVLRVAARSQANVELQRIPGFSLFQDLNFTELTGSITDSLIIPIMWIEEVAEIDEKNAGKLRDLANLKDTVRKGKWGSILVGMGLMAASTIGLAKTMT